MYTRLVVQYFCLVAFAWVYDEQWHMLLIQDGFARGY